MKLKDIYCEFRQNGEILITQGLDRKENYISSYHSAFENFNKTLEFYNFGKELEINEFKKLEKKYNKTFGIKNIENYFEKIYKENLNLMNCILEFNKNNFFLKKAKRIKKNIFGCFTMKELELKYGIKGNKKILLYKKREKECYIKELRRDFVFMIDKKDLTIKKGNLEFLIDGYSTDLDFCFYRYFIKNRKE